MSKLYMAVLRHTMDDLPIFVDRSKKAVLAVATKLGPDDGDSVAAVLSLDATTPLNVSLYTFENGRLVEAIVVKEFE